MLNLNYSNRYPIPLSFLSKMFAALWGYRLPWLRPAVRFVRVCGGAVLEHGDEEWSLEVSATCMKCDMRRVSCLLVRKSEKCCDCWTWT